VVGSGKGWRSVPRAFDVANRTHGLGTPPAEYRCSYSPSRFGTRGIPSVTNTIGISNISLLDRLREKRKAASDEANQIVRHIEQRGGTVKDAEEARCKVLFRDIDEFDERIKDEQEKRGKQDRLAEARNGIGIGVGVSSHDGTRVSVTGEPMVYGGGADNSYYADSIALLRANVMAPNYRGAYERMMTWSNQVEHEVADGSKFGVEAERQLVETLRTENAEIHRRPVEEVRSRGRVGGDMKDGTESRAIASGGGTTASASGGGAAAFVTPVFGRPYIPYREYGRAFADQCFKAPLPDYGLAIYKPQVTGPAGVAQQTETSINSTGVTEVDPTAGYAVATLVVFARASSSITRRWLGPATL
jgi:hypothetical protein